MEITFWIYRWIKLLLWLLFGLLLFELSRLLMFIYHYEQFQTLSGWALIKIFWGGLRFDLVSVVMANSLVILISSFPLNWSKYKWMKWILVVNFIIFCVFLIFNLIDIPYFSFIHKRSTADIFFQLGGQTDVLKQLPEYLSDYWWIFLLSAFFFYISYRWYYINFFTIFKRDWSYPFNKKSLVFFIINLLIITLFYILSVRGGTQRIPLDIVDAGFYAEPQYTALVINTPFSIIKSIEQKQLESLSFFNDEENIQQLRLVKKYSFEKMMKKNIIVIILESFSKEYTALGQRESFTPFLDSLMKLSIVFENAWSNGTKSIEGIPAIISSMPTWMDNPFINSLYCNNNTHSFPLLLKKENYFSAFFHGGINGTMNFDAYARQAGFDAYFGKNEYNNDKDFDGYWGIWDEPFLQFAAQKINTFKQPFFCAIFTLSSHHPFKVPEKYQNILPQGKLPIQQSIAYTDLALKKFFDVIQQQEWYSNTLFVITADHTGISEDAYYSSIAGRYQIPLLIFNPENIRPMKEKNVIQQIDILPTILHLLNYPHIFFSFGNNYFENKNHYAVFYENGTYYLADDSNLYSMQNFKIEKCWQYNHTELKEIQVNDSILKIREEYLKRIIQAYNNTLINNNIYEHIRKN
ncbi:MAG: sulfatase-like hydrolase/transferase [Bacteroidota bacterium]